MVAPCCSHQSDGQLLLSVRVLKVVPQALASGALSIAPHQLRCLSASCDWPGMRGRPRPAQVTVGDVRAATFGVAVMAVGSVVLGQRAVVHANVGRLGGGNEPHVFISRTSRQTGTRVIRQPLRCRRTLPIARTGYGGSMDGFLVSNFWICVRQESCAEHREPQSRDRRRTTQRR